MSTEFEKDINDEVYEDSFYGDDEELVDEEEEELALDEEGEGADEEVKFDLSFACDDCDYRWDDTIVRRRGEFEEGDEIDIACPMCGSMNVTQI
jgi:rubrerythrin